ncbi:MAG: hypothetical protein J7L39_04065 [Candidatus Aenigmarchaeota archaeon]|nr:hypothetical protein [Candidatus Aenigmarchaeota archaeon]
MNTKLKNILDQEEAVLGIEKILDVDDAVVKKLGIENKMIQEALQEVYERVISELEFPYAERLERYAKQRGINLDLETALQKTYETALIEKILIAEYTTPAEELEEYAKQRGINLDLETALQKTYGRAVKEGCISLALEIQEYAQKRGIKVKVDKEMLQKGIRIGYERAKLAWDFEEEIERLEEYARKMGIQVEEVKDIDIEDIKTKIEKNVDGLAFIGIYGLPRRGEMAGMFVLGEDEEGTLKLIFDNTYETFNDESHEDIARDYKLKAIGGGQMEIDVNQKKIRVYDSSEDFDYEPRIVTAALLQKAFPDWDIKIEK